MKKRKTLTKRQSIIRGRLEEIRDVVRLGGTSSTGKTIRAYPGGPIVGRHKGGMSILYPELKYLGMAPGVAARAITRGKGKTYRRLVRATSRELTKQGVVFPRGYVTGPKRDWKAGSKTVPAHPKLTRKCKVCKVAHTRSVHRFHGAGAMEKTHLFAFGGNPMLRNRKGQFIKRHKRPSRLADLSRRERREYEKYRSAIRNVPYYLEHYKGYTILQSGPDRYYHLMKGNRYVSQFPNRGAVVRFIDTVRTTQTATRRGVKNPPYTKIYEKVLEIRAQKGPGHRCDRGCAAADHRYYHRFKSKPKMWGLTNGDILIKS